VITLTSTVMVNKIFQADRQKAKTMVMAEQTVNWLPSDSWPPVWPMKSTIRWL
jgi:hypothetical protein